MSICKSSVVLHYYYYYYYYYFNILQYNTVVFQEYLTVADKTMEKAGSIEQCSDIQIDYCHAEVKRCNVEKQRRYMEQLRTPEKKTQLIKYRQKRAEQQRELWKRKKLEITNSVQDFTIQNSAKQNLIEKLTPEDGKMEVVMEEGNSDEYGTEMKRQTAER